MLDLRALLCEQLLYAVTLPRRVHFRKLTFVFVVDRLLDRTDGVEQGAVARLLSCRVDQRGFHRDEPLLNETADVTHHGFLFSADGATDGDVAGAALIILPIFDVEQVGIDGQLARGEVEREDLIWQREVVFDCVAL